MQLFKRDFIRCAEREVYPIAATLNPYLLEGKMDLVEFGGRVNINLSADLAGIDRDPIPLMNWICFYRYLKVR